MKLVIVASGDFFSSYGGGQIYVKNLVDELLRQQDKFEIQLSIVSCAPHFPTTPVSKWYQGVTLFELNPSGDFCKLFSSIRPDIVHAHGEKAKIARACHYLGIRCIVTAHHGGILCPAGTLLNYNDEICRTQATFEHCLPCYLKNIRGGLHCYPLVRHLSSRRYLKLGKLLSRMPFVPFLTPIGEAALAIENRLKSWQQICLYADVLIAPSNAIAENLRLNGIPESKIWVLPHGIPLLVPTPGFPSGNDPVKFYYVGRINRVKGIHILLEAFSSIQQSNIELHVIGGAENKSEHRYQKQLQTKYRNDKRIIWHGKIPYSQLEPVVKDFHCLIHPAIYLEVFGLSISEALSLHKYVIATRCGGPEMQILSKSEGTLISPNDPKALAEAIKDYCARPVKSSAVPVCISQHIRSLVGVYCTTLAINQLP